VENCSVTDSETKAGALAERGISPTPINFGKSFQDAQKRFKMGQAF